MGKLILELKRLYFLEQQQWYRQTADAVDNSYQPLEGAMQPENISESLAGKETVGLHLVSVEGMVRVMVLGIKRTSDWPSVVKLLEALQNDLELPIPAVSVSGQDGYQLWFSLAVPVPVGLACTFLEGLCQKFLGEIPFANLTLHPNADACVALVPSRYMATEKWTAFIDPGMGSMFLDSPWLEMAPNLDRQAELLAGFKSISLSDFERTLLILKHTPNAVLGSSMEEAIAPSDNPLSSVKDRLNITGTFNDPVAFLLSVMNEPSASASLRVEAAKALLPYCSKGIVG